jgi:hypothetical protein
MGNSQTSFENALKTKGLRESINYFLETLLYIKFSHIGTAGFEPTTPTTPK